MPVIAVNLSQKTYTDIMDLVGKGAYSGPEQFLEIAAFNQLALERGLTPQELLKGIFRPADTLERSQGNLLVSDRPHAERPRRVTAHSADRKTRTIAPVLERRTLIEVLDEEIKAALSRFSRPAASPVLSPCDRVPTAGNSRIWGQVNRLFPLKAACRWIINAAAINDQWPDLDVVMQQLAADAAVIGSSLEKRDADGSRKRDEMLGTGLPRKGNLQSSDRYLTQFIARVTRSTAIYPGAISDYGLACVSREKVMLTASGVELGLLPNPILDTDAPTTTLSEEERRFLMHHISDHVLSEKNDFKAVLKAITEGSSRPAQLMTAVRSGFPLEWTDVVFRTHIYGVLARLSELGMIAKRWQGRTVEYQVADSGLSLVAA
jgi:hypothetical protein